MGGCCGKPNKVADAEGGAGGAYDPASPGGVGGKGAFGTGSGAWGKSGGAGGKGGSGDGTKDGAGAGAAGGGVGGKDGPPTSPGNAGAFKVPRLLASLGSAANGRQPGVAGDDSTAADTDEVASTSAVKVCVAVRPLLPFEVEKGCKDILQVMPPHKVKLPSKPTTGLSADPKDVGYPFDFDRVYRLDGPAPKAKMYEQMGLPVLERFCQGFNATILAYGQTGSGKTYTMGTTATAADVADSVTEPRGLIPGFLMALFSYMKVTSKQFDITLKLTFIEIYNEQIIDLLAKASNTGGAPPAKLDIRERPDGEVFVDGATEVAVQTVKEAAQYLELGNSVRATAAHKMNEQSSRSHAVLTLCLEQRAKPAALKSVPAEMRYRCSKCHLVDLAGCERQKDTGTTGARFTEGVSINKGLLELGNVINALAEGRKHVPYRNSKLSRMLQDSLGGSSETLFIACVSPADANHDTTLNTLRYASRARSIRNNLRLKQLSVEEELEYLRQQVAQLTAENAELRAKMAGGGAGAAGGTGRASGWVAA